MAAPQAARIEVPSGDLARAARLLKLRTEREATGLFAGNYRSAFRGGGLDFEESRPYAPGDDVRRIDWNTTARTGTPFVKRFREERDRTLLLLLDVSASMRFGTGGRSKAQTAAHALALLAAAAGRAGDRVGLVAFDAALRAELPAARGVAHGWRVIRTALEAAAASRGTTRLDVGLERALALAGRRAVIVLLSDFRDVEQLRRPLALASRRCELVAAAVLDPAEERLPRVGPLRLADPERPGASFLLDTNAPRARERYANACAARRRELERTLRRDGADLLWLRTDRSPFHALARFFRERASRRAGRAA